MCMKSEDFLECWVGDGEPTRSNTSKFRHSKNVSVVDNGSKRQAYQYSNFHDQVLGGRICWWVGGMVYMYVELCGVPHSHIQHQPSYSLSVGRVDLSNMINKLNDSGIVDGLREIQTQTDRQTER